MYVPVFRDERYTIQEIKRAQLGATTVDGVQQGRGAGDRGRCDLRLLVYKRLVSTQKQHACCHNEIIKESVFFYSNLIIQVIVHVPST